MKIEPRTLKGFRDFLPSEARKRQYVISKLKAVFESYGFEPLETPALEYADVLTGKYGDEGDKLMYKFKDNGDRDVALRYDQTVPLSRVVAQYSGKLPLPFKRYQIQNVWRAENTQKGRFREFLQCDIDTVGADSPLSDREILSIVADSLESLGIADFRILLNDRDVFEGIPPEAITIIDKLKKIGEEGVKAELEAKGLDRGILEKVQTAKPTERIRALLATQFPTLNYQPTFSPTLARGLDYYTGIIIEVEIEGYLAGSVGGGGRYDSLIGMFSGQSIPAVGFAFGFDRLMEALEQFDLFPQEMNQTKILVTLFDEKLAADSLKLAETLRKEGLNAELYLNGGKMEKQLKYADQKGIPYAAIIGPEEKTNGTITLKTLKTHEQKTLTLSALLEELR